MEPILEQLERFSLTDELLPESLTRRWDVGNEQNWLYCPEGVDPESYADISDFLRGELLEPAASSHSSSNDSFVTATDGNALSERGSPPNTINVSPQEEPGHSEHQILPPSPNLSSHISQLEAEFILENVSPPSALFRSFMESGAISLETSQTSENQAAIDLSTNLDQASKNFESVFKNLPLHVQAELNHDSPVNAPIEGVTPTPKSSDVLSFEEREQLSSTELRNASFTIEKSHLNKRNDESEIQENNGNMLNRLSFTISSPKTILNRFRASQSSCFSNGSDFYPGTSEPDSMKLNRTFVKGKMKKFSYEGDVSFASTEISPIYSDKGTCGSVHLTMEEEELKEALTGSTPVGRADDNQVSDNSCKLSKVKVTKNGTTDVSMKGIEDNLNYELGLHTAVASKIAEKGLSHASSSCEEIKQEQKTHITSEEMINEKVEATAVSPLMLACNNSDHSIENIVAEKLPSPHPSKTPEFTEFPVPGPSQRSSMMKFRPAESIPDLTALQMRGLRNMKSPSLGDLSTPPRGDPFNQEQRKSRKSRIPRMSIKSLSRSSILNQPK